MPTETELFHQVIRDTVYMDELIFWCIKEFFGINYKGNNIIEKFDRFFMEELGSSTKAEIIFEIAKDLNSNKEIVKDFKGKLIKYYRIRNIFAHSLSPRDINQKKNESTKKSWEELAKEHKELHNELEVPILYACGGIRFKKNHINQ